MKATGIVRRIDDLGRVVIPKEIRRTMRIREGDPLEIYTDRDGEVIFKKYSPAGEMLEEAQGYCDTLQKSSALSVVVSDRDVIIAAAGVSKKECLEKKTPPEMDKLMDQRRLYTYQSGTPRIALGPDGYFISAMMPILSEGDVVGAVASIKSDVREVPEAERMLIQTAGLYLGRQMET